MRDKEVDKHIRDLLTDETALTPLQVSKILGCRDRDVKEFIRPSFYTNGRPKYIAREVFNVRRRMQEAAAESVARNRRTVRSAAA